jgi:hypothetical protein
MSGHHLKKILQFYYSYFTHLWPNLEPSQLSIAGAANRAGDTTMGGKIAHYKFMCKEAQKFVDEGKVDKAMRWLGFIQGVLWIDETFTLNELKSHCIEREL